MISTLNYAPVLQYHDGLRILYDEYGPALHQYILLHGVNGSGETLNLTFSQIYNLFIHYIPVLPNLNSHNLIKRVKVFYQNYWEVCN